MYVWLERGARNIQKVPVAKYNLCRFLASTETKHPTLCRTDFATLLLIKKVAGGRPSSYLLLW